MTVVRTFLTVAFFLAASLPVHPEGEKVKLNAYAEYHLGEILVVDGQQVRTDRNTEFKGDNIGNLRSIPLGFEVKVRGRRLADGSILATRVEAKPNGMQMFEADVLKATNLIEREWVKDGVMFDQGQEGDRKDIGKIQERGNQVSRARLIMKKLVPPYVAQEDLRVRVVETKEWNASAMGNGAIWVYSGLMKDMSDDELAIILGHELAHYTHEHSRRGAKQRFWAQLFGLGGMVAAEALDGKKGTAVGIASLLGMTVWSSGYSRDMEDQADRVGLRYVSQAGYNVHAGPQLWSRFREKYGEADVISNFFIGSHSRASDRIKNLEQEISINYRTPR